MQIKHKTFHLKLLLSSNSTRVAKKCVWQVTTIIQPALRHLGTSHFLKVLYNKTPKGQIRWPIFLFLMYMLVEGEPKEIPAAFRSQVVNSFTSTSNASPPALV